MKSSGDVVSNLVYRVSYLDDLPLTAREIAKETDRDPVWGDAAGNV